LDRPNKNRIGICMVVGAYYPEITGSALQCFNLVESLKDDFDFYVIATYKISSKIRHTKQIFTEEILDKTKVFRINLYPGKIISEILSLLAFFIIFFKIKNKVHIFHMIGYTRKSYLITLLAKIFRKKTIVKTTSFGIDDPLSIKKRSFFHSTLYSLVDTYIVTSPAQQESFRMARLPEDKILMIPNGVNLNRFNTPSVQEKSALRQQMGIPDSTDVILSVSFFSQDKGLDIFAESLLLLPQDLLRNIFLIFVGSKDEQELEVDAEVVEKVHNIIDRLGINSRCLFRDSTHDICKYFNVSDIFILPSKREGLPNALLEAMASGLCCIANRLGGITDYIIDSEKNGYLLNTLAPNAIANILTRTIGNKAVQNNMGNEAHSKIRRAFNMDQTKARYVKLYADLLGRMD